MSRTWVSVSLLCFFCLLVVAAVLTTLTAFTAVLPGKVAPLGTDVAVRPAIHPVATVASSMDSFVRAGNA